MANHIIPGFTFNKGEGYDFLTIENLNKLVSEARISPQFVEETPNKEDIRPFDKILILDSLSKSFRHIEGKDLFLNAKLTGDCQAPTPSLSDNSDRIVTTKYLNLFLNKFSKNEFCNVGLFFSKTCGIGNGSKIYSLSHCNSNNPDKYLIFVDGELKEHLLDYTIDYNSGSVCFETELDQNNTYLFLTLNNNSLGPSHFNKFILDIKEDTFDLSHCPLSTNDCDNYLIFNNKKFLFPEMHFSIVNGKIIFKKVIEKNSKLIIYAFPTNNDKSNLKFYKFTSSEDILEYKLPMVFSPRAEDCLVFIKNRILIPEHDYVIKENLLVFSKNIPLNLDIGVYVLLNFNNNTISLNRLDDEQAEHGDILFYNKEKKSWAPNSINNFKENLTQTNSQVYSLKCSSIFDIKNKELDINHLLFSEDFDLEHLEKRVLINLKKQINICNLVSDDAMENDILMFREGKFKAVPNNLPSNRIIPLTESCDIKENYANNILLYHTDMPINLNIPHYEKENIELGSKITIFLCEDGLLKITSDKEIEIVSLNSNFIFNKKGSKIELLKLTHRKWFLSGFYE